MLAAEFSELTPGFFPVSFLKTKLIPEVLMLRHEFLSALFGPGANRETGGHIADVTALQRRKPVHVRALSLQEGISIRRSRIFKPDDRPTDVFMEVTDQFQSDPQRRHP